MFIIYKFNPGGQWDPQFVNQHYPHFSPGLAGLLWHVCGRRTEPALAFLGAAVSLRAPCRCPQGGKDKDGNTPARPADGAVSPRNRRLRESGRDKTEYWEKFFTLSLRRHRNELSREAVHGPSLAVLGWTLGTLVSWKVFLPRAGGLNEGTFKVPFDPNKSVILWSRLFFINIYFYTLYFSRYTFIP